MKGVYFLQNANNVNFKLFLDCIHDPQSKYSVCIEEEFWIMNHFECHLNRGIWRSNKVVQVVQITSPHPGQFVQLFLNAKNVDLGDVHMTHYPKFFLN